MKAAAGMAGLQLPNPLQPYCSSRATAGPFGEGEEWAHSMPAARTAGAVPATPDPDGRERGAPCFAAVVTLPAASADNRAHVLVGAHSTHCDPNFATRAALATPPATPAQLAPAGAVPCPCLSRSSSTGSSSPSSREVRTAAAASVCMHAVPPRAPAAADRCSNVGGASAGGSAYSSLTGARAYDNGGLARLLIGSDLLELL